MVARYLLGGGKASPCYGRLFSITYTAVNMSLEFYMSIDSSFDLCSAIGEDNRDLLESRYLRLRLSERSFPGNQGVKTLQVLRLPFLLQRSLRSIK